MSDEISNLLHYAHQEICDALDEINREASGGILAQYPTEISAEGYVPADGPGWRVRLTLTISSAGSVSKAVIDDIYSVAGMRDNEVIKKMSESKL